jgi:hypothetical protein
MLLPPYRRYLSACLSSRAATAAEAAFYAPRKRALFARLSALGPNPTVVDLGAGTGVNARYLPTNVTRLTAVEPNPEVARGRMNDATRRCAVPHGPGPPLR